MGSHRIKVYLEKHNVGPLFEDLMSKLITEMPTEPLPFLIRILQKKIYHCPQTVMNVPQLRRSLGNLSCSLEIERLPIQRKPSSAVMRRHQRPMTPTAVTVPKKSIIYPPLRGGKILSSNRPASPVKQTKTVNEQTKQTEIVNFNQPDDGCQFNNVNVPLWRPGGYNGPIIPGQVFIEDPFKDELKKHQIKSTPIYYHKEYTQNILDSILISSKFPNKSEIDTQMDEYSQIKDEILDEAVESNAELYQVTICEDLLSPCRPSDDHQQEQKKQSSSWSTAADVSQYNICCVCAKLMDTQQGSSCQQLQIPMTKAFKNSTDDVTIPLLKISKDSQSVKDDLFSSIRSLPLPKSPNQQKKLSKSWYESSLESIYASVNGWKI
ncbi:hypothetical protein CHUAL_005832 [Chamberlinius hualienensis]